MVFFVCYLCHNWHNGHMQEKPKTKPLEWIGTSLKDMRGMPEEVRRFFGVALYTAQLGGKHPEAKPMKGFTGSGVLEVTPIPTAQFIPSDSLTLFMFCTFSRRSQRRVLPRLRKRSIKSKGV